MVQPPTVFSSWGILSRLQQLFLTSIPGIVCLFWEFYATYLPLSRTCNNHKKKWCANCWIFFDNIYIYLHTHILFMHISRYMHLVFSSPNETQTPSTVRSLKKSPITKTLDSRWGPACTSRKPWNALAKWRRKETDSENEEKDTLPKTNSSPLKRVVSNRNLLFQESIFRGELLVSGRVGNIAKQLLLFLHCDDVCWYNCIYTYISYWLLISILW